MPAALPEAMAVDGERKPGHDHDIERRRIDVARVRPGGPSPSTAGRTRRHPTGAAHASSPLEVGLARRAVRTPSAGIPAIRRRAPITERRIDPLADHGRASRPLDRVGGDRPPNVSHRDSQVRLRRLIVAEGGPIRTTLARWLPPTLDPWP